MIQLREEVAEDDEVISAEEIAESEAAWQDYQAGRDRGISSQKLKLKLFGEKNGLTTFSWKQQKAIYRECNRMTKYELSRP